MRPGQSAHPAAVLATLSSCGVVVAIQQTVVLPVLLRITGDLGTAPENGSWILTAGLLAGCIATPVISRLADLHGRRRLLQVTLAGLLVGSVLGVVSSSLPVLLIARTLQGTAVALIPVGIAVMRDVLPTERVPMGVATMSATLAIGATGGMPLAGVMVDLWGWHSLFWPTLIGAAILMLLVQLVVPETEERAEGRTDPVGAVLLLVALTGLLLALSKGGAWGWGSAMTLVNATSGILVLAWWVRFELRHDTPLVDLRQAFAGELMLAHITSFGLGFVAYANMMTLPVLLQEPSSTGYGQGLSALEAGLWMTPMAASFGVAAPLAAALVNWIGAGRTLGLGALIMAVTYTVRVYASSGLAEIVAASALISTGTAFTFAAMPILIMGGVATADTAAANGFNHLLRTIGSTASTAACAAITAAIVVGESTTPAFGALATIFWVSGVISVLIAVAYARSAGGRVRRQPAQRAAVAAG